MHAAVRFRRKRSEIDPRDRWRSRAPLVAHLQSRALSRHPHAQSVVVGDNVANSLLQSLEVDIRRDREEERLIPVVGVGETLFEEPALDRRRRHRSPIGLRLRVHGRRGRRGIDHL